MSGSKRKRYFSLAWEQISSIGCSDVKLWCLRRMPILQWAPKYSARESLLPDTISGVMLTVQQVAQGLAFAAMSSVHPVFGLYGSLFPPLIYAVFGMGRHVSTGTFAITSLISAGAVERLVSPNNSTASNGSLGVLGLSDFEMQRIGVAAAVTFLGGIIQMSLFLLQLGSATLLLSEPVVSAMTTGAATHVVTSQVKYLLGMKIPYISGPLGMFYIYIYILKNIKMVHKEILLLSIFSLVVLVLVKELNDKFKQKIKCVIPIDLILIITMSLSCYFASMESTYGIDVVGHIPKGIPLPQVPTMGILSDVVSEAFGVALVGYTVSIFLAYNSSNKFKYPIEENQELFAHGLSNIIPSFLYCIPNAGAPARSNLLYNNGAKSQVACLISCALVLLVIYFVTPLLYWLPMCVLACIVVVALKGMLMQFQDLRKLWNVDKFDWTVWVCTYLVTICFAANIGLLFGVLFSIALGLFRLIRVKTLRLVNLNEELNTGIEITNAEFSNNVKIVSVASPICFLNAKKFYADFVKLKNTVFTANNLYKNNNHVLLRKISDADYNGDASDSLPLRNKSKTLIVDCSRVTFFDYTGIKILIKICLELKNCGTKVLLASCHVSLVQALQYCEFGTEHHYFFESVHSALSAIQLKNSEELSLEALGSSDV
ncbi:anion exchange transporter [Discoglossus pictus]